MRRAKPSRQILQFVAVNRCASIRVTSRGGRYVFRTRSHENCIMDPLRAGISDVPVTSFEDGLGRRYRAKSDGERQLEILCFHAELTEIPSFEFSLRERVNRVASLTDASYASIAKLSPVKEGN